MKTFYFIILVVVALFSACISGWSLWKLNTARAGFQTVADDAYVNYVSLQDRLYQGINNEGVDLSNSALVKKIHQPLPTLVLTFPKLACTTCLDSILNQLLRFYDRDVLDKITIAIDSAAHSDYVSRFMRFHQYNFNSMVSLPPGSDQYFNVPDPSKPYFYVIGSTLRSEMFFVPDRDKPNETKRYIDLVINKFVSVQHRKVFN